jgi:hypothetical protein
MAVPGFEVTSTSRMRPVTLGQCAPWRPVSQPPKDTVEGSTPIRGRAAALLPFGKEVFKLSPLSIAHVCTVSPENLPSVV